MRIKTKWAIIYKKPAQKYLDTLNANDQARIKNSVEKLSDGPYDRPELDIKPLKASNSWRMRVGKFRVIFEVNGKQVLISVVKIAPRGEAYKD